MAERNYKDDIITVQHLADNKDIYEPMRDNEFELIVPGLGDLIRSGSTIKKRLPYDDDTAERYLRIAVNKVNIPNFEIGVINIKRGNMEMKAAGTMSFAEGSLELIDYVDVGTKSILMAWQRLAGDPVTERVGRMRDYKKEAELIEYTCDHDIVRRWRVIGAWIRTVSDAGLSHEGGNDKRAISATLVFDKCYLVEDRALGDTF